MNKLSNDALYAATMTDYHNKGYGEPTIKLAGMTCDLVEDAEQAQKGDFVYHYSGQLDAFTLCEVMHITPPSPLPDHCKQTALHCRVIDSDIHSEIHRVEKHLVFQGKVWAYKVYRARPEEREALERRGGVWQGDLDMISVMAGQRDTNRRILNRLFYTEPPPKPSLIKRLLNWMKP